MKKVLAILGNIFVFMSLWVSIFILLDRFRLFSFSQAQYGVGQYFEHPATQSDFIAAFFPAVVISYIYISRKKKQSQG